MVVGASLTLTLILILVASFFFREQISTVYEEAENSITGAAKQTADPTDVKYLAEEADRIFRSIDHPKEFFETDREAYLAHFSELEKTYTYADLWNFLNRLRSGTNATALDYVLLYPEYDLGIYIMDASDVDVVPCGEIFTLDNLGIYAEEPGRDFDYFISRSRTYGEVRTDGIAFYTDAERGIYGYILTDIPIREILQHVRLFVLQIAVIMLAVMGIVSYLITRRFRRNLTEPLNGITDRAERFVGLYEKRADTRSETHMFDGIDGGGILELKNLAESLQSMELEMNMYLRDLDTMLQDRARIDTEMNLATQIQASMLFSAFPAFPYRTEFDIYASMTPAKEVGGDFYDFFLLDAEHLALVIADVSGKGVPAAIMMTVAKILIDTRARQGGSPSEIVSFVNNRLCEDNDNEMFVTLWFGILDLSSGRVVATNAGHEYPVIADSEGQYTLYRDKHKLACGAMPDVFYKDYEFTIPKGGRLFVYTDGVPEATNEAEELYGTDRMLEALNRCGEMSPEETIHEIKRSLDAFAGNAAQFDDITMLSVWYKGKGDMQELKIEAKTERLAEVQAFVNDILEANECSMKAQMQIEIAVEELFVNIASYAYAPETGDAVIRAGVTDKVAEIVFIDSGVPYDPLAKADPDVTLSAAERQIGGLGIYMVKKSMDDIRYEHKDGKNILTIRKHI